MSITEQLVEDLKTAMKAQDEVTKGAIRLIRAAVKNAEIEKGRELDDEAALDVLARMAKQHRDSIAAYRQHGREDLASQEEAELGRRLPLPAGADGRGRDTNARAAGRDRVGRVRPRRQGQGDGQAHAPAQGPRRRQRCQPHRRRTARAGGVMTASYGVIVFPGTWSDTDWRDAIEGVLGAHRRSTSFTRRPTSPASTVSSSPAASPTATTSAPAPSPASRP